MIQRPHAAGRRALNRETIGPIPLLAVALVAASLAATAVGQSTDNRSRGNACEGLREQGQRLRVEQVEVWRAQEEQVKQLVQDYEKRYAGWKWHARPPALDIVPLKLQLPFLVWLLDQVDPRSRPASSRESNGTDEWLRRLSPHVIVPAIARNPDERRIDFLLCEYDRLQHPMHWIVSATLDSMTPIRAAQEVAQRLEQRPALDHRGLLYGLIDRFATDLPAELRKDCYDYVLIDWNQGPIDDKGQNFWRTLLRLDARRARADVLGYLDKPYAPKHSPWFGTTRVLSEFRGPSPEVRAATAKWLADWPSELDRRIEPSIWCIRVRADEAAELPDFLSKLDTELSREPMDRLVVLMLAGELAELSLPSARERLRQVCLDERVDRTYRRQFLLRLIELRDSEAERLTRQTLAPYDEQEQRHLLDYIARSSERGKALAEWLSSADAERSP